MSISIEQWDGSPDHLQRLLERLASATTDLKGLVYVGTGNPNGAVTASPPAIYLNRAGGAGTTLYVKEAGVNTNLNWVGK